MTTLGAIKIKLQEHQFDGLYVPGECGCLKEDLAPCGSCDPDDAGWINDCKPGYKLQDPRPGKTADDWAICSQREPMVADDFDAIGA